MNHSLQPSQYKQQVANLYNSRKDSYDRGGKNSFHAQIATQLVEYANIQLGQRILDLATGTGLVAIEVAQLVGNTGEVVGVDIATVLLAKAQEKIDAAGIKNLNLIAADVETLNFAEASFDRVLCCSALPLMTDVPADLRSWYRLLVPGGSLGLCVFAETAFVAGVTLQKVARRYGINLIMSNLTGTKSKCRSLLQEAGFTEIEIISEQFGSYITLDTIVDAWDKSLHHPLCQTLLQLSPGQQQQAKTEYWSELEALVTDEGIWNDITTFFVFGSRPD